MCWHLSSALVGRMVWSGLVMWPLQLCSISLCRPSPSHDGNCQRQINHICWIMVKTIDWVQLSLVEFLSLCVYVIIMEHMHVCPWTFKGFSSLFSLALRACKFSIFFFFFTPTDFFLARQLISMQCNLSHSSVLIFVLILYHWASISDWLFRPLMWRSWERKRSHECIGPANLENPEWFSVMRLQPSRTLPHMPQQFSCLIDGCSNCRPFCLWSFNKVCFHTQRTGWMHKWLMVCVLL